MARKANPRILVVDDSLMWRKIISRTLLNKFPGIIVEEAENGETALALMGRPPDLVITDLMMPVCDGYEMIRRMRARRETRAVSALVVSGRSTPESITRLTQLDIQGFLMKPFSIEDLVINVEASLRRSAGAEALKALPRNAVRRMVSETVHLLFPVRALAPRGFFVALGAAVAKGARCLLDLSEAHLLLGLDKEIDATRDCRIGARRKIDGHSVVLVEPTDPAPELIEALGERFGREAPEADLLILPDWDMRLRVPARSADLSATGLRIMTRLPLSVDDVVTLSVERLLAAIGSKCQSFETLCRVVRVNLSDEQQEAGLILEQAPPEMISDILKWTTEE